MGWWLLVVVGVIVAALSLQAYLNNLRRQMWRQLAARYGFCYYPLDPFDIPQRNQFHLFSLGHRQKAYNCLEGKYLGLPVIVFDYQYTTGSGKSETTHYVSALLARLDFYCPYLIIRPEGMLDRFAALFGFDDINFESDEFNRAFSVKGDDKKFAYDICHPEMMLFLLQDRSMAWELRGLDLLLYSWNERKFDAGKVDRCLRLASEFVARVPGYLRKEAES
jgi:hypothetical protein